MPFPGFPLEPALVDAKVYLKELQQSPGQWCSWVLDKDEALSLLRGLRRLRRQGGEDIEFIQRTENHAEMLVLARYHDDPDLT